MFILLFIFLQHFYKTCVREKKREGEGRERETCGLILCFLVMDDIETRVKIVPAIFLRYLDRLLSVRYSRFDIFRIASPKLHF